MVTLSLISLVSGKVYWEGCNSEVDRPTEISKGFYFKLCVRKHKFFRERLPFQFIDSNVLDSEFSACTFVNDDTHSVNFTGAVFENVLFKKSKFGSFVTVPKPVLLEKMVMRSVTFEGCRFDKSAELIFKSFELTNVTFDNCIFESDTTFELGQMQEVNFKECEFKRSPGAKVSSENNALMFSKVTVRRMNVLDSQFLYPIVFEFVNGADMNFNDTKFDEFWCHGRDELPRNKGFATSAFNDTTFQRSQFLDKVHCDLTTWRRMQMFNATFREDADFSRSKFEDIYWNHVNMPEPLDKTCNTLDLSEGEIFRERIANLTVACQMDMSKTRVAKTSFLTVKARDFIFTETRFDQGYIDGKCCTEICPQYSCQCNYTRSPTDVCPRVRYPVDLNAERVCFPGSSNLHVLDGTVRMSDVRHGEKALIGSGHSDVYFFGHRSEGAMSRFVEITHSGQEKPLVISPRHYLYVNDRLSTASSVRVGDRLRDADGYAVLVTKVGIVVERGLYAPTSLDGDLIVDGVRVSSYTAAVHPKFAHWVLSPLRLLYRAGLGRAVERFTLLHERSLEPVARVLRIPIGPQVV